MTGVRSARVLYQIHTTRVARVATSEIEEALGRHPVPTGCISVDVVETSKYPRRSSGFLPRARNFHPPLVFEEFARLKRARCLYRVEAREAEPEDLTYLRSAMLVAGEIAALCDGLIIDLLAWKCITAADVADQIDRHFDPLDHLSLHVERSSTPLWVHTHGMEKFAHPDFEISGVPRASVPLATRLLRHLAAAVVSGGSFEAGEETHLCGFAFRFEAGSDEKRHFSAGALHLGRFRALGTGVTPEMQGLLTSSL